MKNLLDDVTGFKLLAFHVSTLNAFDLNKHRNLVVQLRSHVHVKAGQYVILGNEQNPGFAEVL